MQTMIRQPLTTLQLELLSMFSREVSDNDLKEIKKILVQYFANKAMDLADKTWNENYWNVEDEEGFLQGHERTPYKSKE